MKLGRVKFMNEMFTKWIIYAYYIKFGVSSSTERVNIRPYNYIIPRLEILYSLLILPTAKAGS